MIERKMAVVRARLKATISDDSLRRLVKNSSLLFGAGTLTTLISMVQFPIVARGLGAEHFGVWGIVVSWVALAVQALPLRLSETLVKYLSQFAAADDEARALAMIKLCLLIDLVVSGLIFVVLCLTARLAAGVLIKRPDGADLILLQVLYVTLTTSATVWVSVLQVFDRFRDISAINVGAAIGTLALFVVALAAGGGVAGVIVAGAVVNLGQNIGLAVQANRVLKTRFRGSVLSASLKSLAGHRREIAAMLFSMSVNSLRKSVSNNADLLVLNWFVTPAQVGAYRLARNLAAYFNRLVDPLYDSLYPEVARLYMSEGGERVWALVKPLTRSLTAGLVVTLGGVYLFSHWLIPLIFGTEYVPAVPLFYVLMLTNVWIVCLWAPSVMMSAGESRRLTTYNTLSTLAATLLLLILTPFWGVWGAAAAQVSFHVVWLMLVYPAVRRLLSPSVTARPA